MGSLRSRLAALLPQRVAMHLRAIDHYWNGEPEIRLLSNLVDPRRSAIDAGANIGTYCYFLRRLAKSVVAYEPNPELAARLKSLFPTIRVRQVALSDRLGAAELLMPVDGSGRMQHELASVALPFTGNVLRYAVQTVTVDSECLDDIGFFKIDVEQHERQVLAGAMETVRRCRPTILLEVYPLKYERVLPDEFAFVLREGYLGWFSFDGAWLPFDAFDAERHACVEHFGSRHRFMGNNVVFFPSEHRNARAGPTGRAGSA